LSRMLITIEQTGSPIRCHNRKRLELNLRGLGLNRIGRTAQMPDTSETRGMIAKVNLAVGAIIVWNAQDDRRPAYLIVG
jgi:large subunit ribosomal protein L30